MDGDRYVATDFEFDISTGNLLSVTDAIDRTTEYQYDTLGRTERVNHSDLSYLEYVYDDANNAVTSYDELRQRTVSNYDAIGRPYLISRYGTSTTYPRSSVEYWHDWQDQVSVYRDAGGHYSSYEYDFLGRIINTTNPDLTFWTISYDDVNKTVTRTDENGHKVAMVYDNGGRHVATREYNSTSSYYETLMSYDAVGNLLTVCDARQHVSTMTYDSHNRLETISHPDGFSESQVCDDAGRVISRTDRSGRVITSDYDYAGRLTSMVSSYHTATNVYDDAGQVLSKTLGSTGYTSTIVYSHNDRGLVDYLTQSSDSYCHLESYSMSFEHNFVGKMTSITYPDSTTLDYYYDDLNRVTDVKEGSETLLSYTYYDDGLLETETTSGGQVTTYDYNLRDWPDSIVMKIGTKTKLALAYTYDDVGNVETIGTESYGYDYLNRLTSATGVWGTSTYGYDGVGNRMWMNDAGTYVSYAYDDYNKLISSSGGEYDWEYDYYDNGCLYSRDDMADTFRYYTLHNELDQLHQETKYVYDARKDTWTKESSFLYEYDANGARASVIDEAGDIWIADFIYLGHDMYYEKKGSTETCYVYVDGRLEAKLVGSSNYFYIQDALGSTHQVWLEGSTKAAYQVSTYKPFGIPVSPKGAEDYLYAGERMNSEAAPSGLYYLLARSMDPETGRFISLDTELGSLSTPQTLNRYVYCVNNPLKFIDPTGEGILSIITDAVKDNWKTIVVVTVIVAVTVATGGIGLPAMIALSAVITSGVEGLDTWMKGGDLNDIGWSMAKGFIEGAVTGVVGAGIGAGLAKAGAFAAKGILTGALKPTLNEVSKKVGAKALGGVSSLVSKVSPSLSRQLSKVSSSLSTKASAFRTLDDLGHCGLSYQFDTTVASTRLFAVGHSVAEELSGTIVTSAMVDRVAMSVYSD
jgi:RHS repeat-associated protein